VESSSLDSAKVGKGFGIKTRTLIASARRYLPENAAFPTDTLVKDSQKLLLCLGEEFIPHSKGIMITTIKKLKMNQQGQQGQQQENEGVQNGMRHPNR
jgi:hypothetical protein